jgi:hypothetical protein
MRRTLILSCLAIALAAQPAAAATTVSVVDAYPDTLLQSGFQPEVLISDQTGDVNALSVSYTYATNGQPSPPPGDAVVTVRDDSADLEAGEGCEPAGSKRVRCTVEGILAIRALLGGGADTAGVEGPDGGISCTCVRLLGGDGNDRLTSQDGAGLEGDAGDDVLSGLPSTATTTANGFPGPSDDGLSGGDGNDVLDGGIGDDHLAGGAGDDVLRGGAGGDNLFGAEPADDPNPPAGRDDLHGGSGRDVLDDGDDHSGPIGPDKVVGGRGFDTVDSYLGRTAGVSVNLSRPGGDGQAGEGDSVVNVETVYGGTGNDTLVGDGDANQLFGGDGSNRIRGRGGDDYLDGDSTARNALSGDRGDDHISVQVWTTGPVNCGRGHDIVFQSVRGEDAPREPSENDPGVAVAANCESIRLSGGYRFGLDPVPGPVSGRLLTFDRLPAQGWREFFSVVVTPAEPPYRHLGKGTSTREGVTVELPADVARRARRRGMALRAELWEDGAKLRMIWRFRVPR